MAYVLCRVIQTLVALREILEFYPSGCALYRNVYNKLLHRDSIHKAHRWHVLIQLRPSQTCAVTNTLQQSRVGGLD